ncbi:MAG: hypothetical protein ACKO9H_11205 [Planctomycetota bacterium]
MSRNIATTGALVREIQNSANRMKKVRRMLTELRGSQARETDWQKSADMAIEAVAESAAVAAALTPALADPEVMLKVVQMQRFATGLLVRARRVRAALARPGGVAELSSSAGVETDDDWAGEE